MLECLSANQFQPDLIFVGESQGMFSLSPSNIGPVLTMISSDKHSSLLSPG